MSLTKTDLKAIEDIVSPRFDKLEEYIDGLRDSVAAGFGEMDERFKQVDERFKQVDERFKQVDERFDEVDRRFDAVDEHFNAIEDRLKTVESDTSRLRGNFMGLKQKVVNNNP
jgi:archaellum component FlaC